MSKKKKPMRSRERQKTQPSSQAQVDGRAVAKAVLMIVAAGALVTAIAVAPGLGLLLGQFFPGRTYSRSSAYQSLRRFEQRGYVRRQRLDRTVKFTLTKAGREHLDRYALDDLALPPRPKAWDKLWRLVCFDIPEDRKQLRSIFRRKLQDLGFQYVQRSVWLYPFPCEDALQELARRLSLEQYILIATTQSMNQAPKFTRRFNL